ncbi:hypothetical protein J7K06_07620 [Candidatus Bathyarchaeota archaeon]|nr:hypothetical protein [Candidatus Bathyarchaeota archaeon]
MKKIKVIVLILCLVTAIMTGVTLYVYAYNDNLEKSWNAEGGVSFSLAETEPVENCPEISDPLDIWTKQAIENLSATIDVYWSNYSSWQLYNLFFSEGMKVFKYQDKYYTFDEGIFFDPAPPPAIPQGPIYGGWTLTLLGWVSLIYKKTQKRWKGK